ncbi:hypothetical protein [Spectribacter hydrogenoxidans]|uniref:Isoprenylcysteine carboxyl methyltransferase (ICMT) family protein n=1 Tax=Spectribacter hydrogenoxidans TaxID=3075608 RepID=A0ABU3BYF8_9GAMM|nr:hypothetical protein [Salinisphaera sp. W335]MDT0634351.1 hypothetical protein [Salinisphaera sp. W335]
MSSTVTPSKPPASATHPATSLLGLAGLAGGLLALAWRDLGLNQVQEALFICLVAAMPMMLAETLWFRRYRECGADRRAGPPDVRRVAVKLLGLYSAFVIIGFGYWLFPEYAGTFYGPFFYVLRDVWPWLAVLAVPYFAWLDARLGEPFDGAWHAGMAVLGRWQLVDRAVLGQFARGWLIKAFFLPLMFALLARSLAFVLQGIETGALWDQARWFRVALEMTFLVDLVFGVLGYTLAMRWLDSHIRSAEPTLLGWLSALACYQPLWGVIGATYLAYDSDGFGWQNWLAGSDTLTLVWSVLIIGLAAIYAWATVAFGLRFSNLTHRGIITSGPFRVTKHPAYIAKNLSYWLIAVPFVAAGGWDDAVRNSLLLFLVNAIYYVRARTEERHLALDPVYVEYALWIERHGWLRKAGEWCPALFRFRWRSADQAHAELGRTGAVFGTAENG